MARAKDCPPQAPPRVLSPAAVRAYAGDWALFTDWCAGTGHQQLPADPDTVAEFLSDNPASAATLRRRITAINHRHTATGYAPPERSPAVLAAMGRRPGETPDAAGALPATAEVVLRALPSHGWTQGMFGRRDRCLLVMSQLAGIPYKHLAELTGGMVTVAGGAASAAGTAGATTLTAVDDPVLCGPCAITRWLRVLDVVMTKPSHRVLARQLEDADPVTSQSPHLCRSTRGISPLVMDVPLLPSIDQWGFVPFPLQRLTPHSLSRLVHQMLAGDLAPHRHIPVNDEVPEPAEPPAPAQTRAVYTREDAQRAWARRRNDLSDLAGIDDVLAEIDARAKELQRRTAAVLAQTSPFETDQKES